MAKRTTSEDLRWYFQHRVREAIEHRDTTASAIAEAVGVSDAWVSNLRSRAEGDFKIGTAERLARYFDMTLKEAIDAAEKWAEQAPRPIVEEDLYRNRARALERLRGAISPEAERRVREIPFDETVSDKSEAEWIAIATEENRAVERERLRSSSVTSEQAKRDTAEAKARIAGAKKLPSKSKKKSA